MRKVLKRLLSKLFIVSTIIILQMVWFFLLFYTASAGSRIFDMILKIAAFFLAMYIANRQMKTGKPYFLHLTDGFWLWIQRKTELTGCGCRLKRMNG